MSFTGSAPAVFYHIRADRGSISLPFLPDLPDVSATQTQTMGVDFGTGPTGTPVGMLPAGVTVKSPVAVALSVAYGGPDLNPQSHIPNAPTIGAILPEQGGSGAANTAVLWQVAAGCVVGTRYLVKITFGRSDNTDTGVAWTHFNCVQPN